jgi:hypothetical protein
MPSLRRGRTSNPLGGLYSASLWDTFAPMPRKTAKPLESQTSLRLPSETLAHLQKLADAEGLKVADLIRRAIAQVFPKK